MMHCYASDGDSHQPTEPSITLALHNTEYQTRENLNARQRLCGESDPIPVSSVKLCGKHRNIE